MSGFLRDNKISDFTDLQNEPRSLAGEMYILYLKNGNSAYNA